MKKRTSVNNLTKSCPVNEKHRVKDHKGNSFASITELCKYYNLSESTFNHRIKHGWNLEKALTTPPKKNPEVVDHNGKIHKSINDMCHYYHINQRTLRSRLEKGLTLEEALTEPLQRYGGIGTPKICTDHKGNIYGLTSE